MLGCEAVVSIYDIYDVVKNTESKPRPGTVNVNTTLFYSILKIQNT